MIIHIFSYPIYWQYDFFFISRKLQIFKGLQTHFHKNVNSRKIFKISHCLHDAGNYYQLLWFNFRTTFHNSKIEFCWTVFSGWFMPQIVEKTPSFCTKLIREGSILSCGLRPPVFSFSGGEIRFTYHIDIVRRISASSK